jgi:uncharacterized membrane protein
MGSTALARETTARGRRPPPSIAGGHTAVRRRESIDPPDGGLADVPVSWKSAADIPMNARCTGARRGATMQTATTTNATSVRDHFQFHLPHAHLASAFGNDWFGLKAEAFARFFGTPTFLIAQSMLVALWIAVNIAGVTQFDVYPFILLNLAFSLQAAYAAPLILLAQTRQADRDKALSDADVQHREALAAASLERQDLATRQSTQILELLEQNTALTKMTQELSERIEALTGEIHGTLCRK